MRTFLLRIVPIIFIGEVMILAVSYVSSGHHLYNISNYALAVAFGFASLCFSWSRAENDDDAKELIMGLAKSLLRLQLPC